MDALYHLVAAIQIFLDQLLGFLSRMGPLQDSFDISSEHKRLFIRVNTKYKLVKVCYSPKYVTPQICVTTQYVNPIEYIIFIL